VPKSWTYIPCHALNLDVVQNSKKLKTVWNDVAADNTLVYTQADVQAICERALFHAIKANPSTKDTLAGVGAAESSKAGAKGKKATANAKNLKPKGGLNNGFVTKVPKTGINMCVTASETSCFPTSLKAVGGAEGSECAGDVGIDD
jgi:hypothetical protein